MTSELKIFEVRLFKRQPIFLDLLSLVQVPRNEGCVHGCTKRHQQIRGPLSRKSEKVRARKGGKVDEDEEKTLRSPGWVCTLGNTLGPEQIV